MTEEIIPIETTYSGRRFRSRTEARWAVFFDALGWPYEYEKEGYDFDGRWYLPDFYLPGLKTWVEVKGLRPTDAEVLLCRKLCELHQQNVWIAVGQPAASTSQLLVFKPGTDTQKWNALLADRRNEGEYWLAILNSDRNVEAAGSIGPVDGPNHGRWPLMLDHLQRAYAVALSERFDGK